MPDIYHLRGRNLRAFSISHAMLETGWPLDLRDAFTFCLVQGEYFKPPADMEPVLSWSDAINRREIVLYAHPGFEPFDDRAPLNPLPLFVDKSDLKRVAPPLVLPKSAPAAAPIDMVLHCPVCGIQHIDEPEPASGWSNPPHRSHKCERCGCVWRPADVATNGVAAVKTRGERDTYPRPAGAP